MFLPPGQALDFWLIDFTTGTSRPITHFSDRGGLRTFDITPDGKEIVFDRSRQNSDILLMELPKR